MSRRPIPSPPVDTSRCPYCGAVTVIMDAAKVYGGRDGFGEVLACTRMPACDAYVGLHRGTTIPKGTLANRELRHWRKRVHAYFDLLWSGGRMTRPQAYEHLARIMGVPSGEAHIAWLSVEQCQRALELLVRSEESA